MHDYLKAKIDVFEYFFFALFQKGSPKMHFKSFFKKKSAPNFESLLLGCAENFQRSIPIIIQIIR